MAMYLQVIPLIDLIISIRDESCDLDKDDLTRSIDNMLDYIQQNAITTEGEKSTILYCLCAAIDQSILHNSIYCQLLSFNLFTSSYFNDDESGFNIISIINLIDNNPEKYEQTIKILNLLTMAGFIIQHHCEALSLATTSHQSNLNSSKKISMTKRMNMIENTKVHMIQSLTITLICLYQSCFYTLSHLLASK